MSENWFHATLVAIVVFAAIALLIIIPSSVHRSHECQDRGGVMVRTPDGHVCIKKEVVIHL